MRDRDSANRCTKVARVPRHRSFHVPARRSESPKGETAASVPIRQAAARDTRERHVEKGRQTLPSRSPQPARVRKPLPFATHNPHWCTAKVAEPSITESLPPPLALPGANSALHASRRGPPL